MNKTTHALNNSIINTLIQLANIVIKFAMQTALIKFMGAAYIGINGLCTNILGVLSLAELGIGAAIILELYKPLATDNKPQIIVFMKLYKKVYLIIGCIILGLGLIITPFVELFVKGESVPYFHVIFFLFVLNSASSYFFAYKRILLSANQQDYRNRINMFIFDLICVPLQIVALYFMHNFIVFILIRVIFTFLTNIAISRTVDKQYPYINDATDEKISKTDIASMKEHIKEIMGNKIGGVIINASDNILIARFVGIIRVGQYANYSIIWASVFALTNLLLSGANQSYGHVAVHDEDGSTGYSLFRRQFFLSFVASTIAGSIMLCLFNPFMQLWAGPFYVLDNKTVFVIVINFFLLIMRGPADSFIFAYGVLKHQGRKSVIEAIVNLVISLLFVTVFDMDIMGVLLGTIIAAIVVNSWWSVRQIMKHAFHKPLLPWLLQQYFMYAIGINIIFFTYYLTRWLVWTNPFINLVYLVVASVVVSVGLVTVLFFWLPEYRWLIEFLGVAVRHVRGMTGKFKKK
ncbi:MAG: hypothetical protein LBN22_01600 [Clostridiales Family XIII bacterium]|jgi:O-antigen/teichoic acid export membrane protein|nr:hypothetical protein [Clostridiales Family XIII bacterium]